jgi:hypothetical protein
MKYKKVIMKAVCLHCRLQNSGMERPYELGLVSFCSSVLWLSVVKFSSEFNELLWNQNHFTVSIDMWQNRPIPLCTSQISQSLADRLEMYRKCSPIVLHDPLKFSCIYHLLDRNGTMIHMEILSQVKALVYSSK